MHATLQLLLRAVPPNQINTKLKVVWSYVLCCVHTRPAPQQVSSRAIQHARARACDLKLGLDHPSNRTTTRTSPARCSARLEGEWTRATARAQHSLSRRSRRYLCGSPPVASATRRGARQTRQARRLLSPPACVCVPLDAALLPVTVHETRIYLPIYI